MKKIIKSSLVLTSLLAVSQTNTLANENLALAFQNAKVNGNLKS